MSIPTIQLLKGKRSELRKDPVSGDWMVLAPGRFKRPHGFPGASKKIKDGILGTSIKQCPFERLGDFKKSPPLFIYGGHDDWSVQVIPNKFPALLHGNMCSTRIRSGPYTVAEGVGYHEVLVTRDHFQTFADLDFETARQVFEGFKERYRFFSKDSCVRYVSLFQNWGTFAGASLAHPHYQIIAIPVVPPNVSHSLHGSWTYFKKNKACIHCVIMKFELRKKQRIVFENERAVAFAPFFSREPFEIKIFPKKHLPYFEDTEERDFDAMVDVLQQSLCRLKKSLRGPDYNFFIHTSPLKDKKRFNDYHWHIEVLPKLNIAAGFELGTGIEINTVDPNVAAAVLRKVKVSV